MQVCRLLFARVDSLFSIGSQLIKPEWHTSIAANNSSQNALKTSESSDYASSAAGNLLTQQMADQLARKLTGLKFCNH